MKKLYYLSAALTLLLTKVTVAQTSATLVTKVDEQKGKLIIPYEKYVLANGLTVIINEDHSDPIVHVEVTYHVGSNRETPKRTGFAHFFEHMMFQGSQNVQDEEHFKIVQGSGGDMNGTTNRDRTNYFETVPSNMLETALWLEADRMGFLLPAFTKKKFETQRATVKNEKDQRYGDGYGMLPEVQDQTIYPYGHPYSWQTIGYVDDLNEADSNDLKNFFLKWYGPNNAILVISGDVNTQEALKMVEKYFGSINRGPEPAPLAKSPIVIESNNIKVIESKIFAPLASMTFPTVPTFHKDEAPLDLLASLIGDGKNSPLYKNFVDPEYALQIQCSNGTFEIAGEFNVVVVGYPTELGGLDEKETRDRIMKSFTDFETNGFTDEDLKRLKSEIVSRYYGILETVASKSSVLTSYEMLTKGKMTLDGDIQRYLNVTKEDIMRVYRTYIKDKNYACVHIKPDPKANDPEAKAKKYESVNPYVNEKPNNSGYTGLVYKPSIDPAGFNRSIHPPIGPAKSVSVPNYYKTTFDNGIKVIGVRSDETPRVYINMTIKGGHLFETGKVKNGTAAFLAAMMTEGTTTKSAIDVENKLRSLGSEININGGEQSFSINIECYKDSVKQTLALFEDLFFNSSFTEKEFKLIKKAIQGSIKNSNFSETNVGAREFQKMMYGSENPIGIPSLSDYSAAGKITIEDLKHYRDNFLSPNMMTISVVGDIDEKSLVDGLSFLKKWQSKNLAVPTFNNFPPAQKTQIYLLNQDYAKQSTIFMGYRTIPSDIDGDFFKANVMNFALGGAFNSRLNLDLREDKGWTYGIRSAFSGRGQNYPGLFFINAGINTKATDSAIAQVFKIVKNYIENGITDEELEFTKRSLLGEEALSYESPFSKLAFLTQILNYNLDASFTAKRSEIIKNLTKQDIDNLAKKYLSLDNMVIVVVGDDVNVKEGLEKLNLGKIKVIKMPK